MLYIVFENQNRKLNLLSKRTIQLAKTSTVLTLTPKHSITKDPTTTALHFMVNIHCQAVVPSIGFINSHAKYN